GNTMHVGDISGSDFVIGIGPEMSVAYAATRMADEGVGCLVVIDRKGDLVGIVTDRDLMVRVIARNLDPAKTTASTAMTPDPITISASAEIEEAARVMREGGVRRLPVLNVDDRLA